MIMILFHDHDLPANGPKAEWKESIVAVDVHTHLHSEKKIYQGKSTDSEQT